MADIALVHLGIDSSGVVAGEKQATRSFQNITSSADKATQTLSGMGGPIGRLASSFGSLAGNASSLVAGLGLIGGAAAAAAAAITGLSAALLSAAIDGGKMADEIVDLAGVTGVSVETLEGLEAGFVGLGGKATDSGRAISRFSNLLGEAATGEAPKLEKALRALGVTDFSDVNQSLNALMTTLTRNKDQVQTNALAMQLLGREGAKMVTVWRDWNDKSSELNATLDRFGLRIGPGVTEQASKIGNTVDVMSLAFDNLKKKIAFELTGAITTFGETFLTTLKNLEPVILATARLLNTLLAPLRLGIPQAPRAPGQVETIKGERTKTISVGGQEVQVIPGKQLSIGAAGLKVEDTAVAQALKALLAEDKKPKAGRAPKAVREITEFTPEEIGDPFRRGLESAQKEADATAAAIEAATMKQRIITEEWLEFLRILSSGVERPVLGGAPPIQTGGPGQPIPGGPVFTGLPPPETIRTEEQERLDEQFAAIFDDMLFSVLTAQKTLGEAFGDLALGIVDTFAAEFAKAMREAFITPIIKGLTDLLVSGLKSILASVQGQLSGGGGSGFWAGLLGSILGGAASGLGGAKVGTPSLAHIRAIGGARYFAEGGVIGAGQWGIVGERGPEYIFAGAHPATIAPMTGGGGGSTTNINFAITTPSGQVDKRTQDQIATQVYNAVKRAQRNEGSR